MNYSKKKALHAKGEASISYFMGCDDGKEEAVVAGVGGRWIFYFLSFLKKKWAGGFGRLL
jgi:hypothetical protein